MKALLIGTIVLCALTTGAWASNVNLNASDMPLEDAIAQLAQQSGAGIVLDPKASGSVTVNLTDTELTKALDIITTLNKLTWKKLVFAKLEGSNVKLDDLKSSLLTMASMPLVGLTVEDPQSKTSTVFAKDLAKTPDTSAFPLPQGYVWNTVYVVFASEAAETKGAAQANVAASQDRVKAMSAAQSQSALDMAGLTSDERQAVYSAQWSTYMSMAPEVRKGIMADQARAAASLSPQYRDELTKDLRQMMRYLRKPQQSRVQPRNK